MSDPSAAPAATPAPRKIREKSIFMLHDPKSFASIGKFSSTDFRYAANKAASRGFKDILLRKTNTKLVMQYTGAVVDIPPTVVKRGDREITYSKKPKVTFVKKFVYEGEIPSDDSDDSPTNPRVTEGGEITAPKTPKAPKKSKKEPSTPPSEPSGTDPPPAPVKAKKPKVSNA